jgi:hypothetical protein
MSQVPVDQEKLDFSGRTHDHIFVSSVSLSRPYCEAIVLEPLSTLLTRPFRIRYYQMPLKSHHRQSQSVDVQIVVCSLCLICKSFEPTLTVAGYWLVGAWRIVSVGMVVRLLRCALQSRIGVDGVSLLLSSSFSSVRG